MGNLLTVARGLRELAKIVEELAEENGGPPWIDRVDEMPINRKPSQGDFVRHFRGEGFWPMWPTRDVRAVTGLTVHHTWSHSAKATAEYCAFSKGYPTVQYHFWVSADDGCPVYLLARPEWMVWHDCTGAYPTTLSVGLAGRWDVHRPPLPQIRAAAKLCRYLMDEYGIGASEVKGHRDRWQGTECPGWDFATWREVFYGMLG